MSLFSLLFSFRGRISRKQWWLGVLAIVLGAAAALGIAFLSDLPLLAIPFFLAIFVATYALSVKRLHDRGKSGAWALVFIFLPGVADRWSDRLTEDTPLWWVVVLIGSVLVHACARAEEAPPRLYEMVIETAMPHLEENLRYATTREKRCLEQRELWSAFPVLSHSALKDCRLDQERREQDSLSYTLVCEGGSGTTRAS